MDFELSRELQALAAEAEEFAREWSAASPIPEDAWLIGHNPAVAQAMAERGWIGMTWPASVGGGGRPPIERFLVFEQLIGWGVPLGAMYFADRQIGPTLLQFGSDWQQHRWLPDILSGKSMWCIGMSEPDNGSDLANLRTSAVLDGASWVVNGDKVWTSGAALADWIYLVARTDSTAAPHAGLSEFVINLDSEGVEVRPIVDLTGNRHFCQVRFDNVRVPAEHLVGEINGSFRQLMRQLEHERGGIDRLVSNRRLIEDMRRGGRFDGSDPLVRQELAKLESHYRIGRQLVLRQTLGQAPPSFSAATKTFCANYAKEVARFCFESAGPGALLLNDRDQLAARAARSVCYSTAYTLMGGTDQILRNVLGERVLRLPR
jgi:alkylation response protein AidB-like acyl-CoA dehydrogenase